MGELSKGDNLESKLIELVNAEPPASAPLAAEKPWYTSKTLWGIALMMAVHAWPKLAPALGDDTIRNTVIENGIEIIGGILAIVGRVTASKNLIVKKGQQT